MNSNYFWGVEYDGVNGYEEEYLETFNHDELIEWVTETLQTLGGGHADIYDEYGDFVEDLEI